MTASTGPADLVERQFRAPAPNRLWVADLTYVKTHSGWVYVAFIVDVFSRMVVGWQASRSLRSDLAIDALEMAVHNRRRAGADLDQLIHHSDRGVQYLCVRYSERLAENDIVASVGSKGDSYDNALVECFNGLYKWELIYPKGPWTGPRGRRVRHPHLRRLVQPPTPPRPDRTRPRLHHPGRVRGRPLPSDQSPPRRRQDQPPSLYETRGASGVDEQRLAERAAEAVDRDGNVLVLVRVDADDDIAAFKREASHDCCPFPGSMVEAAGWAGRTGLRWDLVRSGSYEVTARSAGGALHRWPGRPTRQRKDTKSIKTRVRPPGTTTVEILPGSARPRPQDPRSQTNRRPCRCSGGRRSPRAVR